MAKQIEKTPAITAQMQKIAGEGVDVSNLPVFEAIAANSLPVSKKGSIYDKSVMQQSMLTGIADFINANGLPLHTLHMQGIELPVGKVFQAEVMTNSAGLPEVHVLFWASPTDPSMVANLDNGTIDEVSLGVLAEHALCSECGFDFFGEDATSANWWDRTCANDHTIGTDGVHLNLSGSPKVFELSLVSTGAVQNSKIVSGARARLASQDNQKLAASGIDITAAVLFASGTLPAEAKRSSKETPTMAGELNLTELVTQLTSAKVDLSKREGEVATLTARITALETENTELKAKVPAEPSEIQAKLTDATGQLDAAVKFLRDNTRKALIATGADASKVDEMSVADMVSAIEGAQAKLSTLFPAGGKAIGAVEDADDEPQDARLAAFNSTRK